MRAAPLLVFAAGVALAVIAAPIVVGIVLWVQP